MATPRMDITSFVGKLLEENDVDLLPEDVKVLAQAVMETVSQQIGAAPYERSHCNGRLAQRLLQLCATGRHRVRFGTTQSCGGA